MNRDSRGEEAADKAGRSALSASNSLKLNSSNLLDEAALQMACNADQVVLVRGGIAISPDNVDVSARHLMIPRRRHRHRQASHGGFGARRKHRASSWVAEGWA